MTPGTGSAARKGVAIVVLQAQISLLTLLQLAIFGQVLDAEAFDSYAVWITAGMFLTGLAQAAGTERVVIGRRTQDEGRASAKALGLGVALVSAVTGTLLGRWELALAAIAYYPLVRWDFERFTQCFDRPWYFVRRDLVTTCAQVASAGALAAAGEPVLCVLSWWAVGGVLTWFFASRASEARAGSVVAGARVLRRDPEIAAVLTDSGLGGLPFVAALALLAAQGDPGEAASARLAVTLLGPITIVGLAARRMLFSRLSRQEADSRLRLQWAVLAVVVVAICVPPLLVSRTPLWELAFGPVPAIALLGVLLYAGNHGLLFAAILPNGELKAMGLAAVAGRGRVAATVAAGLACAVLVPLQSSTDVALVLVTAGLTNLVWLTVARRRRRPAAAQPRERLFRGRYS